MALQFIPNQAFEFTEDGQPNFNERNAQCKQDGRVYCQPVLPTMQQSFQIRMTEHTGTELLTNGNFTTDITSWTQLGAGSTIWNNCVGGDGCAIISVSGNNTSETLTQASGIVANKYYKVCVTLNTAIAGTNANSHLEIFLTGTTSHGGTPQMFASSGAGEFCAWFLADGAPAGALNLQLTCNSGIVGATLALVTVLEYTLPTATVVDSSGATVATLTPSLWEDIAHYDIDWSDYTAGDTYTICLEPFGDLGDNLLDESNNLLTATNDCIMLGNGLESLKYA